VTRYSKQSQRLAHKVAKRASNNLEKSGKFVSRSATTGRYVVMGTAKRNPKGTVTQRKDA
jgi:hypothetical protein